MRKLFMALAALIVALGLVEEPAAEQARKPLAPIIAQLVAEPEKYADKLLMIYGLVVESRSAGKVFMLQDVSQRPLKVVGRGRLKAAVGDQVTVIGRLKVNRGEPYVAAKTLIPTRVVAGGGCC